MAIRNPFDIKARVDHDAKPRSSFFENGSNNNSKRLKTDGEITFEQAERLSEALIEALIECDYPSKLKQELIIFAMKLGKDGRLFPDMDTVDIWYTDYYDLIKCAEKLGLGDFRLPHWSEECNNYYKYLELSKNELIIIFISITDAILGKEETSKFDSLSIDWNSAMKEFTNKLTKIEGNNKNFPLSLNSINDLSDIFRL